MGIFILVIGCLLIALLFLYVWSLGWAIGDAQRRGYGGGLMLALLLTPFLLAVLIGYGGMLALVLTPLVILIWWIVRPKSTLNQTPHEFYRDPDEALAAASKLDAQGDWDAAIGLYRYAAVRWPEHADYVEKRIAAIADKQQIACG